jgi:acyl carrier protein
MNIKTKFKPWLLLAGVFGPGVGVSTIVAPTMVTAAAQKPTDMVAFVRQIVAKHYDRSIDTIIASDRFVENFGADSLDFVELTITFEEKLGVSLKPDTVDLKSTVSSVAAYLSSRM